MHRGASCCGSRRMVQPEGQRNFEAAEEADLLVAQFEAQMTFYWLETEGHGNPNSGKDNLAAKHATSWNRL